MISLRSSKWTRKHNPWFTFVTVFLIGSVTIMTSCKKDEPEPPEVVASFQFEIDETDYLKVSFTNYSANATTYSWDFGDMESSTEENPVHTYAEAGTYTVTLEATGEGGTATYSDEVDIVDPLAAQRALIGDNGKEWRLIADVSGDVFPYMTLPADFSDLWWAFGGYFDYSPLCVRYSIFNDVWTFNTDGTYDYDNKGDFWGDWGVWPDELVTNFDATNPANWTGKNGQDLSGWNSGTHSFVYDPTSQTITVTGGFIGLPKAGTTDEVTEPQAQVVYDVLKLVDVENGVDTLVLQTTTSANNGLWISTLVSYDNPADIIVIEECPPVTQVDVTFKLDFSEYSGTATTPYISGTFNGWSGDANVMTDDDQDGIYEVTLTLDAETEFEYKFTADNWADEEVLTEGMPCTVTSDGVHTNRSLTTGTSDMTVGPVCWESCYECGKAPVTELNIDFESGELTWGIFGGTDFNGAGVTLSRIANPDASGINTSDFVMDISQVVDVQGWSGISTVLNGPIDFTSKQDIKIKVWSPKVGSLIKLKLEDSSNADNNKEIDVETTVANEWEELTYTFTAEDALKWDVLVLFFDFQVNAKTEATTHYFDDIVF